MAKVLGFNTTETNDYFELAQKVRGLEKLVGELSSLNLAYEEEVKRLVGEYDKLYGQYLNVEQLLKQYDPSRFGYPKVVDKDIMKRNNISKNIQGIEFIDFSKPQTNE
jgi:hypothetical protein